MDAPPTVGVEEEFLLVDPLSGAPVGRNVDVVRTAADLAMDLQLEIMRCQVETSTHVHTDTAGLLRELRELRRGAAASAEKNDALLLAVAVPPTLSDELSITATPRYRRIAVKFGRVAREQGLCGCHVHVAVPDRAAALRISNFLRPWLPLLLALTANSAIYHGGETGYASWRNILWRRWPSAGPPPHFDSVADFDSAVESMLSLGIILDRKMVYWDVRPSTTFPTVEVRVSDVPATVEETALLATLIRACAMTARTTDFVPNVPEATLRAAYWKAAHEGIDGPAIDPVEGRMVPIRELLDRFVERIRPALEQLGDLDFVTEQLAALLIRGNGARRQLNAFRARGDVGDVLRELATATLDTCR
ncbi:YbdK family carboxylate-amine ligase [Nocardia yunnanensis]|uniref:Putative glutamate--cysteine ligase 2 n=1 Tax=Nocardia yunnanensis TaxID=2382165 RepID=A0A386ZKE8_9NOCA|nr:glutamate--cysteine ligase [Nocardia yunnanensis]AYF77926.1 YbdK family carboxylate-amine ligase [Nocardia yunnanensis]